MSIHDQGKNAVDEFVKLNWPLGTTRTPGPAAGRFAGVTPDCTVSFSNGGPTVPVEVKKSTTSTAQLRPIDYHTTVVWREGEGWWVIPPHEVVMLALDYAGQHCVNSFECFNPGKPTDRWNAWKCQEANVPDRVRAAFDAGEASPLKPLVATFKAEISQLWKKQKSSVRATLPDAPPRIAPAPPPCAAPATSDPDTGAHHEDE